MREFVFIEHTFITEKEAITRQKIGTVIIHLKMNFYTVPKYIQASPRGQPTPLIFPE